MFGWLVTIAVIAVIVFVIVWIINIRKNKGKPLA
jgi:hypothetical protein